MVFEFCSKNRKPLLAFLINRRKRTTQSCTHLHGIVRSFVRKNRHKSLTISRQSMETNNQSDLVYIKHRGTKFCNNLSGNGQERHGVCGFVRQPQRGWTMLNRGWLPEGEHLRIISSSFSHIDPKGVEPRLFCPKSTVHPFPFHSYERAWATVDSEQAI